MADAFISHEESEAWEAWETDMFFRNHPEVIPLIGEAIAEFEAAEREDDTDA